MSDSVLFHAAKVENTCYSDFKQMFHLCYNYDIAHFFVVLYNKVYLCVLCRHRCVILTFAGLCDKSSEYHCAGDNGMRAGMGESFCVMS